MEKHFVTFLSPGTFVHEESTKEIESWDATKAVELAHNIKERHGATPFGFYFTTRTRGENDLDSKVSERSKMFYLGGKVETLAEVLERNDPKESNLRSNMQSNGYDRIIVNTNSWKVTMPLGDGDTVLEFTK